MSPLGSLKSQIGEMIESRFRRVLQQAGRHNSAPDDPFLRLQWMIKHESGLIQDLLIRTQPTLDEWTSAGYSVYSQFEEDGLIQHLIRKVKVDRDHFVEIGIEDYRQSNTRFLLEKSDWTGHVMDCVDGATQFMDTLDLRSRHTVDFTKTLVTRDNINDLLANQGEIGLFSLDIDSMDYYVFEAMHAKPSIVILEYMATYGPDADVSVPFGDNFNRFEHHYTGLCFGASLKSLNRLAIHKGYSLVGCTKANAFFVRDDCLNGVSTRTCQDAFTECRYRDSRGPNFELTFISSMDERRKAMRDAVVYDFQAGNERTIAEVYGL